MKMPRMRLSWFQPRQDMSPEGKFRRSEYAKRLLADATLNEALDAMAEDAFDALLRLDHLEGSDRSRAIAVERVKIIKEFREQLTTFVRVVEGTGAKQG